jgi:hypothetical protein
MLLLAGWDRMEEKIQQATLAEVRSIIHFLEAVF